MECDKDSFLCKDKSGCFKIEKTCGDIAHCVDGSDKDADYCGNLTYTWWYSGQHSLELIQFGGTLLWTWSQIQLDSLGGTSETMSVMNFHACIKIHDLITRQIRVFILIISFAIIASQNFFIIRRNLQNNNVFFIIEFPSFSVIINKITT